MEQPKDEQTEDVPWQQDLFNSVWLLAGLAILFLLLSHVVWGWIDLLMIPIK